MVSKALGKNLAVEATALMNLIFHVECTIYPNLANNANLELFLKFQAKI